HDAQRAGGSILEVDGRLRPLRRIELPEPVVPDASATGDDRVVWPLSTDGFACVGRTGPTWIAGSGDAPLAAARRYRRIDDPIDLCEGVAYRSPFGGWIAREQPDELRIPVDRYALESGCVTRFEIVIPLDRPVSGAAPVEPVVDASLPRVIDLHQFRGDLPLVVSLAGAPRGHRLFVPVASLEARPGD
ncbi:MAG: hypothetical protein AAGA20_05700, partial [Planctomycetota bacterium]